MADDNEKIVSGFVYQLLLAVDECPENMHKETVLSECNLLACATISLFGDMFYHAEEVECAVPCQSGSVLYHGMMVDCGVPYREGRFHFGVYDL